MGKFKRCKKGKVGTIQFSPALYCGTTKLQPGKLLFDKKKLFFLSKSPSSIYDGRELYLDKIEKVELVYFMWFIRKGIRIKMTDGIEKTFLLPQAKKWEKDVNKMRHRIKKYKLFYRKPENAAVYK